MLAGTRLGNHPRLAHELRQQRLAQAVIDLVRARMVQILPFQVNLRPAQLLRQPPCMKNRTGPAHIIGHQRRQLILKVGLLTDRLVGRVDVIHRLLQRRRHQLSAVAAKIALRIGKTGIGKRERRRNRGSRRSRRIRNGHGVSRRYGTVHERVSWTHSLDVPGRLLQGNLRKSLRALRAQDGPGMEAKVPQGFCRGIQGAVRRKGWSPCHAGQRCQRGSECVHDARMGS